MTPNTYDSAPQGDTPINRRSVIIKQAIVPVISLLAGLIAFVISANHFRSREAEIQEKINEIERGAERVDILIAKGDLPKGVTLRAKAGNTPANIQVKSVYRTQIGGSNVSLDEAKYILGRKTLLPIPAGEPIFWSSIEGGKSRNEGLSETITEGMRAISISVSGAASVSGMVQPNDRIDVLGTFNVPDEDGGGDMTITTITLLQDVTVLATGDQTAKTMNSRKRSNYNMVTLLVTPLEAEWLKFTEQIKGSLALSLRNPVDGSYETKLQKVDFAEIEETLLILNKYRQTVIRKRPWSGPQP